MKTEYVLVKADWEDEYYELPLRDRVELKQYLKHKSIETYALYTKDEMLDMYVDEYELYELVNEPTVNILKDHIIDEHLESQMSDEELSEQAYDDYMDIKMDAERLGE